MIQKIQKMKNLYLSLKVYLLFSLFIQQVQSQSIATFNSVAPGAQTASFVIPGSHTFQRIIKSGDLLNDATSLGNDLDFTGYVPKAGSSRSGYLSISSESTPAKVAIMSVDYNYTSHTWTKSNSGNVPFPTAAFGSTPVSRFCSGGVTPNGTIIVCEEQIGTVDQNGDGYIDIGWNIEIDPVTKTVMESDAAHTGVDKLWALGRHTRENVVIASDNRTLYTGADHATNGYVYKFVANTAGNFSSGQLYVLVTTGALGTGTWAPIANTTQADRNNTVSLSATASAYNFNGVEDIEISPIDNKVYFTAKGPGRVYRFTDNGTTVSGLQVFVENTTYDVDPGAPVANEAWGIGNDNLAFDGEGNLWVLQDGGRNHIWVVGPTHTASTPAVRLFGKTPAGSEPTGITFTPDYKFMFISLQHPSVGNAGAQVDAAGITVNFSTHTTVVIARLENLGSLATLPVQFTHINAKAINNRDVQINWTAEHSNQHAFFALERSENGVNFEEIYRNTEALANAATHSLSYMDLQKTNAKILYYRVKQCNIDGSCTYSKIQQVKFTGAEHIKLYPSPATSKVNIGYTSLKATTLNINVINEVGNTVITETKKVIAGENSIQINIQKLKPGTYTVMVLDGNNRSYEKLIKL